MKIAMLTYPYWGHIGYLIRLGNELQSENEVIIFCGQRYKHEVEREGILFGNYSVECEEMFLKIKGVSDSETGIDDLFSYYDYIFAIADKMVKNYPHFDSENIDLIIYDSNCFWGKIIAAKLGIPSVCVVSTVAINQSMVESFPDAFIKYFNVECDCGIDEHNLNKALRLISRNLRVKYPALSDFSVLSTDQGTAEININLSSKEIQYGIECIKDKKYLFTGPFISEEQLKGTSKYIKRNKINVTLSFGTIFENIENIVQIIEQVNVGQINLIVVVSKYYEKLKRYESENVHIINFTNLIQILKDTDILIFHGGTNSYREAAFLGVPMIAIPQSADQYLNAYVIEKMGIGKYIEKEELKDIDIKKMIFEIISNKEMQIKCKDIAESIHKLGGLRAAKKIIEHIN